MSDFLTTWPELDYHALYAVPVGGQGELGQVMWLFIYQGEIIVVDAGAGYPARELPGVDLLLPNSSFLEANQDKITALLLTNGHEEHAGALTYLTHHVSFPRILAPRFVAELFKQNVYDLYSSSDSSDTAAVRPVPAMEEIEVKKSYQVGPFEVEWIVSNNAIADACALRITCDAGTIIYTSSFKFDQTPVDHTLLDVGRLATIGDEGVTLLISDSANVEAGGYTLSEKVVAQAMEEIISEASGRVIVVMPGTNTHRLQILFDVAAITNRKVILLGDTFHKIAVSATITGNLIFDRAIEGSINALGNMKNEEVLVIASTTESDPINVLDDIAYDRHPTITVKDGDTIIFSSDVLPGRARHMAHILDELLLKNVKVLWGQKPGVHVSKHASKEELKLMLSVTKPRYFAPAIGEGRHITQHGEIAAAFGLDESNIFVLTNGDMLEISRGIGSIAGSIAFQPVLFNREQGERVTTASVNERRILSLEGVVTIGLTVTASGEIVTGPTVEVGASGFLRSNEWATMQQELDGIIREAVTRTKPNNKSDDVTVALRSSVREAVIKALRQRLSAKPTVQVLVHQVNAV